MRRIWFISLCLLILCSSRAPAQPCPANLRPVDDTIGYRLRHDPDRCEGFYTSPVAGEELELLSFLNGKIAPKANNGQNLLITVPNVRALDSSKVIVLARALPLRVYYRMDASVPSAGSMLWPIGRCLSLADSIQAV
jgi:hypothetical protein